MLILSISTSSNTCSVSILEDENCVKELNIINQRTHSENLLPLIDKLFNETKFSLKDMDLIACDNGPGSFTGIRIGISSVKAMSEAIGIPVISISSLEALSYNVEDECENIVSLIDARNNQVYCGIFNNNHELVEEYIADDIYNVIKTISKYKNLNFVGDGFEAHKELIKQEKIYDNIVHSKNIGISAFRKFKKGIKQTADEIQPMYLRKSQAERMKK